MNLKGKDIALIIIAMEMNILAIIPMIPEINKDFIYTSLNQYCKNLSQGNIILACGKMIRKMEEVYIYG